MNLKFKLFYLKMKMKNVINRLRGIRDLDNDGKIESVREEVRGFFSQFIEMQEGLEKANENLNTIVLDELENQKKEQEALELAIQRANKKLEESSSLVAKAENEINANQRLKQKVSEFIS